MGLSAHKSKRSNERAMGTLEPDADLDDVDLNLPFPSRFRKEIALVVEKFRKEIRQEGVFLNIIKKVPAQQVCGWRARVVRPLKKDQTTRSQILDNPNEMFLEKIPNIDPFLSRNVTRFQDDFHHQILEKIDAFIEQAVVEDILIGTKPGNERKEAIQAVLNECLADSFEMFWAVLESLSRHPPEFNPKDPIDYLVTNEDIALAFIDTIREIKQTDRDKHQELRGKIKRKCMERESERVQVNNFRGATVNLSLKFFDTFARKCPNPNWNMEVFDELFEHFEEFCDTMSDEKQNGYPSAGVTSAWSSIHKVLTRFFPGLIICTSSGEYLSLLDEPEFCMLEANFEETTYQGKPVLDFTRRWAEKTEMQRAEASKPGPLGKRLSAWMGWTELESMSIPPPVAFLATVRRDGTRIPADRVKREMRQFYPDAMLMGDGAQDKLVHPDLDILMTSKPFGGGQKGMVWVRKGIQEQLRKALHKELRVKGTISLEDLSRVVAVLWCRQQERHLAHGFTDLLTTETLWNFSGEGTYIDTECEKIDQFFINDSLLAQHFKVDYSSDDECEGNPNPWKSARVLMIRQNPTSNLDINALNKEITSRGMQVDCFCPPALEGMDTIKDEFTKSFSVDHAKKCFAKLLEFQQENGRELLGSIVHPDVFNIRGERNPQITQELYVKQQEYLERATLQQRGLRILIMIGMTDCDIQKLLGVIKDSVEAVTVVPGTSIT